MTIKKSFTLIEILVVVTIIVLLTATAIVSYSVFLKQSRDAKRKTDIAQLSAALEMYRSNNDTYPVQLSDLTSPTTYIESLPTDPKSPTYSYFYTGSTSDYTLGAYLENGGNNCVVSPNCSSSGCNYCAGPYGQK